MHGPDGGNRLELDALIFGGGAAGLWLLDELHRRGLHALLVERRALGEGQTVASQGIIHGGIKYTLAGSLTPSARAIREMPGLWRSCLAGEREPNLSATRVVSPCCHLWRTKSVKSKLGLVGARVSLRTGTSRVAGDERPAGLEAVPGEVFRVDEQVIEVVSFLEALARRNTDRLLLVPDLDDVSFTICTPGKVDAVRIRSGKTGQVLELSPRRVIFTAGAGNAALRAHVGLPGQSMQRRPLHMVLVRGKLPVLFGHCVDGAKTRVTITTVTDSAGRTVWQVGGQLSEDGVGMDEAELVRVAKKELIAVLPGVDFSGMEWSSYRVDRAEAKTDRGARPEGPVMREEGTVMTAWPTKLALVPELARIMADRLEQLPEAGASGAIQAPDWPRPPVAAPPWEGAGTWRD